MNIIYSNYVYCVVCIVIHVISEHTEMFWRLWPLAAASEDPPLKQSIPSGQTRPAPLLMTARWRPELTTEQGRDILWRDVLMSGTVGSPPLENGRSAHSDSGTDWCFSLERDLHLASSWCKTLFPDWSVSYFLSVPADLVGESDWSPERGQGGSGGTSPGVRSHSVRPCPQHSGRGGRPWVSF